MTICLTISLLLTIASVIEQIRTRRALRRTIDGYRFDLNRSYNRIYYLRHYLDYVRKGCVDQGRLSHYCEWALKVDSER